MDNDLVIFWCVCFYAFFGLVMTLTRLRSGRRGWVVVYLAILLVAVWGKIEGQEACLYAAVAMWVVFVLIPGLLFRALNRRFLQQRYRDAFRLARVMSWLHPADGWRQQPEVMRALDCAERGELPQAVEILNRFQNVNSLMGMAAVTNLYRLTNKWEELADWLARRQRDLDRHAQMLPALLRAKGETGDLKGLVELYKKKRGQIGKLMPAAAREHCRLMLFAFCGRRDLVERLFFGGSLAIMPATTRAFWLATADMAAGDSAAGRSQLEILLTTDASLCRAIERRLTWPLTLAASLDASANMLIAAAAQEIAHENSFGAQPTLFSNQARGTQILIALNVMMFAVEVYFGGASNEMVLYRLGAMYGPAVRAGEWWRLVAPLFLHFGPVHLIMNMLGLWVLGPFVEFAIGLRRFFFVYLLAGVGSAAAVMELAKSNELMVGASGCIMGLVGATGALMLRGWLRHKALAAKKRLGAVVLIVVTQTIFDSMVPQVSMTAHLSGVVIGFAATMILRDRLRTAE
jgi:rhomboid protease GluP